MTNITQQLSISKQLPSYLSLIIITFCLSSCVTARIYYPLPTGIAFWKFGFLSEKDMYDRCHEDCKPEQANTNSGEPPMKIEKTTVDETEQKVVPKMANLADIESSHRTVFLIRHAESEYNAAIAKVRKSLKGTGKGEDAPEIAMTKYSVDLIDAAITKKGEKQAAETAELMKEKNIGLVIVSPLRRTLQTAQKIFENHPNKPKVVVYPLIKEITSSSCDLPGDLNEIKKEFPDFDFTLVEEHPAKELWFIDILENEQQKKDLYDELYKLYPVREDAVKNAAKFMAQKMLENFPNEYEALIDLNKRVTKAKKWLKEKLQEVKEGEFMAVVTHSKVLQSFIAKEYGALGEFIGSRTWVNCEVVEYNL